MRHHDESDASTASDAQDLAESAPRVLALLGLMDEEEPRKPGELRTRQEVADAIAAKAAAVQSGPDASVLVVETLGHYSIADAWRLESEWDRWSKKLTKKAAATPDARGGARWALKEFVRASGAQWRVP